MRIARTMTRDRSTACHLNENKMTCNACASSATTPFFYLPDLPVHVGHFYDDAGSARAAPRGDVELAYCHGCGHIFNQLFDSDRIDYRPGYEVALYHSPLFRSFMQSVAERLQNMYQLQGKTILEIGAGSGWFLELLCRLGGNRGIGIDPTIHHTGIHQTNGIQLEMIRDRFDRRFQCQFDVWQPDFICCLSVLEHIAQPRHLLQDLRSMLGHRRTQNYFEIFNAARAIQRQEVWSIHYEQCSYFSENSFRRLFESCGFQVITGGGCYGEDQYLFVDCEPALGDPHQENEHLSSCKTMKDEDNREGSNTLPLDISQFARHFAARCEIWSQRFQTYREQNKRVVFWGTGGKGVTFLNTCPSASSIEFVAEINPAKQGKFVPGSAQQIVAPEDLIQIQPDVIIISNAIYEQEIRDQARQMGLRSTLYVA